MELRKKIESLEQMRNESYLINSKVEVRRFESDPSQSAFPGGGQFDTRLVNLEVSQIKDDFMEIFDSEFGHDAMVI